uniref:Ig-like domain-containing protein n=1 Tax=Chrysemys picta bellii TaxID=8478 RepID=A0A8C3FAS9_CHRPI
QGLAGALLLGATGCAAGSAPLPAQPDVSSPSRLPASFFLCHVWGFYPEDVTVTWLRDGRVLTDATRSAPQRNPDRTFNLTAVYIFTPIESDSGSIFSCRVSHAALAQPLQEEFPLAVTGEPGLEGLEHRDTGIPISITLLQGVSPG